MTIYKGILETLLTTLTDFEASPIIAEPRVRDGSQTLSGDCLGVVYWRIVVNLDVDTLL